MSYVLKKLKEDVIHVESSIESYKSIPCSIQEIPLEHISNNKDQDKKSSEMSVDINPPSVHSSFTRSKNSDNMKDMLADSREESIDEKDKLKLMGFISSNTSESSIIYRRESPSRLQNVQKLNVTSKSSSNEELRDDELRIFQSENNENESEVAPNTTLEDLSIIPKNNSELLKTKSNKTINILSIVNIEPVKEDEQIIGEIETTEIVDMKKEDEIKSMSSIDKRVTRSQSQNFKKLNDTLLTISSLNEDFIEDELQISHLENDVNEKIELEDAQIIATLEDLFMNSPENNNADLNTKSSKKINILSVVKIQPVEEKERKIDELQMEETEIINKKRVDEMKSTANEVASMASKKILSVSMSPNTDSKQVSKKNKEKSSANNTALKNNSTASLRKKRNNNNNKKNVETPQKKTKIQKKKEKKEELFKLKRESYFDFNDSDEIPLSELKEIWKREEILKIPDSPDSQIVSVVENFDKESVSNIFLLSDDDMSLTCNNDMKAKESETLFDILKKGSRNRFSPTVNEIVKEISSPLEQIQIFDENEENIQDDLNEINISPIIGQNKEISLIKNTKPPSPLFHREKNSSGDLFPKQKELTNKNDQTESPHKLIEENISPSKSRRKLYNPENIEEYSFKISTEPSPVEREEDKFKMLSKKKEEQRFNSKLMQSKRKNKTLPLKSIFKKNKKSHNSVKDCCNAELRAKRLDRLIKSSAERYKSLNHRNNPTEMINIEEKTSKISKKNKNIDNSTKYQLDLDDISAKISSIKKVERGDKECDNFLKCTGNFVRNLALGKINPSDFMKKKLIAASNFLLDL